MNLSFCLLKKHNKYTVSTRKLYQTKSYCCFTFCRWSFYLQFDFQYNICGKWIKVFLFGEIMQLNQSLYGKTFNIILIYWLIFTILCRYRFHLRSVGCSWKILLHEMHSVKLVEFLFVFFLCWSIVKKVNIFGSTNASSDFPLYCAFHKRFFFSTLQDF